jgi:hypothetical protein
MELSLLSSDHETFQRREALEGGPTQSGGVLVSWLTNCKRALTLVVVSLSPKSQEPLEEHCRAALTHGASKQLVLGVINKLLSWCIVSVHR